MPSISFLPGGAQDISESSSSSGYLIYTVQLSEAVAQAVTVNYRALPGTAQPGIDYYSSGYSDISGTLTFAPGETQKTLRIARVHDNLDEADESVVMELSQPVNADLAGGARLLRQTAFIHDDDGVGPDLALHVSDATVVETDGNQQAVFTLRLSQPQATPLTLDYRTLDVSAKAGQDYVAASGKVTFAAGQTEATVSVTIKGDQLVEATELFDLQVDTTNVFAGGASAVVGHAEILDDDAARPSISFSSITSQDISESSSSSGYLIYTVQLSEAVAQAVTVNYRALPGTAQPGIDYYSSGYSDISGTLTFAPGETQKTLRIARVHDNLDEADELVVMELSQPVNADLAGGARLLRQTAFIHDDDGVGPDLALHVSDATVVETDGNQQAVFTLRLSQPQATPLTLDYRTLDVSAKAGQDYVAASGKVTFAAGQTEATVSVTIKGDQLVEATELFDLQVDTTNVFAGGASAVVGHAEILDDDAARPSISFSSITSQDISESSSSSGYLIYTVQLSEAVAQAVTVNYRALPGTAQPGIDYYSNGYSDISGTLTFAPGETQKTLRIARVHDNLDEADELVVMELSQPVNADLAGGARLLRQTAFIHDDDGVGYDTTVVAQATDVREGHDATAVIFFDLSRPLAQDVSFAWATTNGTAKAGQDFVYKSGIIQFAAGQTRAAVEVAIKDDLGAEGDETFFVSLDTSGLPVGITGKLVSASAQVTIGDNEIVGNAAGNTLRGTEMGEGLFGRNGNDLILAAGGNDWLFGEGGNDVLHGGAGNDVMNGGWGKDTASFAGNTAVRVSLAISGVQNTGTGSDRLISIENLLGSNSADQLTGNGGANILTGAGGDDQLKGLAGHDLLLGGWGKDVLVGAAGNDTLNGGTGNDILDGGTGFDTAVFSGGARATVSLAKTGTQNTGYGLDRLVSIENLVGGALNDNLTGNGAGNRLEGGAGNDTLSGLNGKDVLLGGVGNDLLKGGNQDDVLRGEGQNDTLFGGAGNDLLLGGAGNDLLDGGSGRDTVRFDTKGGITLSLASKGYQWTGEGRDKLVSIENVTGSGFNDRLTGNGSANLLEGGNGNDRLAGLNGNDLLRGGAGWDLLIGGNGADTLDGGAGIDTAIFAGSGAAWVSLARTGAQNTRNYGNDKLVGVENLLGGSANDRFTGNGKANMLNGAGGNDTLSGGGGRDVLIGGAGKDLLIGGSGIDTAVYSRGGGVNVSLQKTGYQNTREGLDKLVGIENLTGGRGNDTLTGNGRANRLEGGEGSDTLRGGGGQDTLVAGGGTDNKLFGGGGADRFVFNDLDSYATTTIADFRRGQDKLVIDDDDINGFSQLNIYDYSTYYGGAYISAGSDRIILTGIDADDLRASDFIFL